MARVIDVKCAKCGADLELTPGAPMATCRFCGHASVIDWSSEANRRAPATGTARATPRPLPKGCGPVALALSAGLVLAGVFYAKQSPKPPTGPLAFPVSPVVVPEAVPPPASPQPTDALQLIREAVQQARQVTPETALESASFPELVNGLVDRSARHAGTVTMAAVTRVPNAPPGKDVNSTRTMASIANGTMRLTTTTWSKPEAPLPLPECTSASAWKTAIQSGVPTDAVARLLLYREGFGAESPIVWSFRVDGHDEHRREIDARTCALRKSWAQHAPPPKTATPPTPPAGKRNPDASRVF